MKDGKGSKDTYMMTNVVKNVYHCLWLMCVCLLILIICLRLIDSILNYSADPTLESNLILLS